MRNRVAEHEPKRNGRKLMPGAASGWKVRDFEDRFCPLRISTFERPNPSHPSFSQDGLSVMRISATKIRIVVIDGVTPKRSAQLRTPSIQTRDGPIDGGRVARDVVLRWARYADSPPDIFDGAQRELHNRWSTYNPERMTPTDERSSYFYQNRKRLLTSEMPNATAAIVDLIVGADGTVSADCWRACDPKVMTRSRDEWVTHFPDLAVTREAFERDLAWRRSNPIPKREDYSSRSAYESALDAFLANKSNFEEGNYERGDWRSPALGRFDTNDGVRPRSRYEHVFIEHVGDRLVVGTDGTLFHSRNPERVANVEAWLLEGVAEQESRRSPDDITAVIADIPPPDVVLERMTARYGRGNATLRR